MTYGYGSNGGYTLQDGRSYKTPTIVEKLDHQAMQVNLEKKSASADEKPSVSTYYDGEHNLNSIKVECKVYKYKADCVHVNSCGWCNKTGVGCVKGNNFGPLENCPSTDYVFLADTKTPPETFNIANGPQIISVAKLS